jgi:hypothetical protein
MGMILPKGFAALDFLNFLGNKNIAFVFSQILRAVQKSATVTLVATSAIMAPMIAAPNGSPVLAGLEIRAGGIGLPRRRIPFSGPSIGSVSAG